MTETEWGSNEEEGAAGSVRDETRAPLVALAVKLSYQRSELDPYTLGRFVPIDGP